MVPYRSLCFPHDPYRSLRAPYGSLSFPYGSVSVVVLPLWFLIGRYTSFMAPFRFLIAPYGHLSLPYGSLSVVMLPVGRKIWMETAVGQRSSNNRTAIFLKSTASYTHP